MKIKEVMENLNMVEERGTCPEDYDWFKKHNHCYSNCEDCYNCDSSKFQKGTDGLTYDDDDDGGDDDED